MILPLCLNDVSCCPNFDLDTSLPVCDVAVNVEAGGTLTICDCSRSPNGSHLGRSGSMGGHGPAIENCGTLNIVSDDIGYDSKYSVIDNQENAVLNLGGSPDLLYITSTETILLAYDNRLFIYNTYGCIYIDYTDDSGNPVVTNVSDDNCGLFLKPDNPPYSYDTEHGTLTAGAPVTYGSLIFAGSQTVGDGVVYYQTHYGEAEDSNFGVTYYVIQLSEGDVDNYDLLWVKESKTLTLQNTEVISSVTDFQNS